MVRKNVMNILLGIGAIGALLVAYNAFIAGNDGEKSASNRLGSYLAIDKTKQESDNADTAVVGTDNENSSSTEQAEQPVAESQQTTESNSQQAQETQQTVTPAPRPTAARADRAETVYTVKEGDTYGCIAEKYYGSYEHYVEIMAANPVYNLGFGEYSLFVDAKLVLPAISAANLKPASSLCS